MPKLTIDAEKLQQVLVELSQCLELEHYIPIKKLISEAFLEVKEEKWRPTQGKVFWYIDSLFLPNDNYYSPHDSIGKMKIEAGNCFRTEEECLAAIEKIKKVLAE